MPDLENSETPPVYPQPLSPFPNGDGPGSKAVNAPVQIPSGHDSRRLNQLQSIVNRQGTKVVCRWALNGQGFVLHMTDTHEEGVTEVRKALDNFIEKEIRKPRASYAHLNGAKRPHDA